MDTKQRVIIGAVAVAVVLVGVWFFGGGRLLTRQSNTKQIILAPKPIVENIGPVNEGNVSPISGIACDNWNGRPFAVMQPADVTARPAAGFSDADMVFEMPVFTNSNTRLMGVYQCTIPNDIGSMRSTRHDNIPLAKGLDAVFIHWGYSKFAETLLGQKIIDNVNCMTTSFCPRWPQTGKMKYEDTGHITKEGIAQAMKTYGYRATTTFQGYPHQAEVSLDNRPQGGRLRIVFPNPYDVSYDYDRATNSYFRNWNGVSDTDKNNNKRVAPKNIVAMIVESEQIKLNTDYVARGVQDPWELVPEEERAGLDYGGVGRYNNLNMGDPWFDTKDFGDAFFYFNGQQYKGTWKKDKSRLDSKLAFYDENGEEVKFVPGQIWVDAVEPGQKIEWTPAN
jgi:hypothetical protein